MKDHPANASPAPRHHAIQGIDRQSREIVITWEDGRCDRFNHIWLRDNCSCEQCGDRSGGHRYLEITSIDPDLSPDEVTLDASGTLQIKWCGDGHLTRYSSNWLRTNAYSEVAVAERQPRPVLWDGQLNDNFPTWDYHRIVDDDSTRLQMFEHIADYGFAILDQVPLETDQIERLAEVFGFIRETHYGRVFELLSTPQQRILAQTAHAIRPHNDELFRAPIPGLFMMHCLRASECGGGASIFVDGFNAAEQMREQYRDQFDLLCQVALPHHRFLVDDVDDVALAAKWPTIELDPHGEVIAVHINERTMAPLDADADQVEALYRALQTMLQLVYAPAAAIAYCLEAGQAAVLDNHRVLHAREAFKGNRHIRQCHVDRDEFFSRLRAQHRRFGSSAQFIEYI